MIAYMVQQNTPEWLQLRSGKPTASDFNRVMTAKTMKLSSAADDYACEIIADRIRGGPEDIRPFTNKDMERGQLLEPDARRFFELKEDVTVQQVGFCTTDDGRFGCSPDGIIGLKAAEGEVVKCGPPLAGLELKCPTGKVHTRYLLDGTLPDEYKAQVHGCMVVTGAPCWYFMSYCPPLPPFVLKVVPDVFTFALKEAMDGFDRRITEIMVKVKGAGQ